MKQWLQKNIWWLSIVITLIIAFFPGHFMLIGNFIIEYWSVYWLQGSLLVIVALLIIILVRLNKKDRPAP
ncbi:hypothetical protein J45TS6_35260 [Paenibacillus sp. J45TS6]|uniref:hypothetical protein n=1 Tax=Paenibacillus sp. J45TS6 TaxID=2807196 RepID=UPI001B202396|nr:hypothetical protein [Paenibacillus sp. J45TS6]GIP45067.1 hypothetical protein J45TS6_35260 [Paenibacillus sp. J45TS6]